MNQYSKILGLLLLLFTGAAGAATQFFQSCESVLKTPPFHQLHEYYARNPDAASPDACFRLNDREFLVTVTDTARIAQGLYYYNSADGIYDFPDGASRPGIKVKREFDGQKHKHFVVLEVSNLHAGEWNTTYEILFLKPRGNGRTFSLQTLLSTMGDPEVGMCGSRIRNGTAISVQKIDVEDEGGDQSTLVFRGNRQECPRGKLSKGEFRFKWEDGRFVESAEARGSMRRAQ